MWESRGGALRLFTVLWKDPAAHFRRRVSGFVLLLAENCT